MDTSPTAEWATLVKYSYLLTNGILLKIRKICPVKLTVKLASYFTGRILFNPRVHFVRIILGRVGLSK